MTTNQLVTQAGHIFSQFNGEILLAMVAISVLLSLTLLLNIRRARKLAKQLSRVQQDLTRSTSSVINIGQQLLSLEKKFNKLNLSETASHTVNTLPTSASNVVRSSASTRGHNFLSPTNPTDSLSRDDTSSIYDQARDYLSEGYDVESVARRCSLSHAEVSLLKALSKKPAKLF